MSSNARVRPRTTLLRLALIGAALAAVLAGSLAIGQSAAPIRVTGADASDYPEGEACLSRIAIRTTFGSVCTNTCTSNLDCLLPGWACKEVAQGSGDRVGLCLPLR